MKHRAAMLGGLAAFAVLVVLITPFCGLEDVPFSALWAGDGGDSGAVDYTKVDILWMIRIPRVAMAALAGAALAVSGMAFQAMFRNPLATPFTLGVSSGASLGAILCIQQGWTFAVLGFSCVSIFAFLGAMFAILLVYGLTRSRGGFATSTMLLAGVAVSFFFSSVILFLQYYSDFSSAQRMLRWVMGGLESVVHFDEVLSVLPFVVTGCLLMVYLTHELNLIATGDELAASRGVELNRTKLVLFAAASLMVGAVVAVCGPIGFVGLMAPHICRLLIGPDHRYLTPATLLFGAAFLVLCDTFARTIMAPTELPVGIITALLGGPFFLWLLVGRRSLGG
jgi:iron complex transport system permease protein